MSHSHQVDGAAGPAILPAGRAQAPPVKPNVVHVGSLKGTATNEWSWEPYRKAALFGLLVLGCVLVGWMQMDRRVVQQAGQTAAAETRHEAPVDGARRRGLLAAYANDPQSLSDEEYRQAALADEEQRQRERDSTWQSFDLPDAATAQQRWQRKVDELQKLVAASESFPPGSVQWHLREDLRQLKEDAPSE